MIFKVSNAQCEVFTCAEDMLISFLFFSFSDGVSLSLPMLECNGTSQHTATSASWVQAILLPQPP